MREEDFNHAIPFLEERSDAARRVVFVGLAKRITVLPINKTCYRILVGAMPSGASARPVHVGLAAVRNAERREAHASPRGLRAPAAPVPPFFGSPKKGGKESSPLATSLGFCLRRATPFLPLSPHTGVAGVARTGPRPKAPQPAGTRQGQKKRRAGHPHKKRTAHRTGRACLKCSSRIRITTTRHAAPLRTPRNGRIGFKPPYSKRASLCKNPVCAQSFFFKGFFSFFRVNSFQSRNSISRRP